MEHKLGFTKMTAAEFTTWIAQQTVPRMIHTLQQHHTWRPNYSHFNGSNHFTLQDNMRHHHVANNGWSDIGQHFSIFPDGVVVTGRALNRAPACIRNKNAGAICIENVGDFDIGRDTMTAAHESAILTVSAAILRRFSAIKANENGVVYHHWFASKSCPGTAFFGGNDRASFNANFLPRLLTALGAPAAPAAPSAPQVPGALRYIYVTARSLNVRQGPGSTFAKITEHGPVELGTVLRVHEERNGWLKVSNSSQNWVFGRYTNPATPGLIDTVDSNVRSGPSTNFDIMDVLQPGDPVFVIGSDGNWRQTGPFLWVHHSLLV